MTIVSLGFGPLFIQAVTGLGSRVLGGMVPEPGIHDLRGEAGKKWKWAHCIRGPMFAAGKVYEPGHHGEESRLSSDTPFGLSPSSWDLDETLNRQRLCREMLQAFETRIGLEHCNFLRPFSWQNGLVQRPLYTTRLR